MSTKDQLLYSALHGTAMRYAAERRNLDESIDELRQISDGRNDIVAEVAGIEAGGVAAGRRGYHRWLLPRAPGVMFGLAIGGSREEAQWRIGKVLSLIGSRPRVQRALIHYGHVRLDMYDIEILETWTPISGEPEDPDHDPETYPANWSYLIKGGGQVTLLDYPRQPVCTWRHSGMETRRTSLTISVSGNRYKIQTPVRLPFLPGWPLTQDCGPFTIPWWEWTRPVPQDVTADPFELSGSVGSGNPGQDVISGEKGPVEIPNRSPFENVRWTRYIVWNLASQA